MKYIYLLAFFVLQTSCKVFKTVKQLKLICKTHLISDTLCSFGDYEVYQNHVYTKVVVKQDECIDTSLFLLDTGTPSMIDEDFIVDRKIKNQNQAIVLKAAHFDFESQSKLVDNIELSVGNIRVNKPKCACFNLNKNKFACNKQYYNGAIGSDIFKNGIFYLNPLEQKFAILNRYVFEKEYKPNMKGYFNSSIIPMSGIPFLKVGVGGEKFKAMWDLGNSGDILIQYPIKERSRIDRLISTYQGKSKYEYITNGALTDMENKLVKSSSAAYIIFDSIALGEKMIVSPVLVSFVENAKLKKIKANVGYGLISRFSTCIDFEDWKIYYGELQKATPHKTPMKVVVDDKNRVIGILKQSEFELKGIDIGDELISLNNESFEHILKSTNECDRPDVLRNLIKTASSCKFQKADGRIVEVIYSN